MTIQSVDLYHAQSLARPRLFARLRHWWTSRPTARQRQATLDLRHAPEALRHDLGLDNLLFTERRR